MLSAASLRSPRGLLGATLIALATGALVTPALGSGSERRSPAPGAADPAVVDATQTSITWRWQDEPGATSYRVYEDGRLVGSPSSPSFTVDGLDCGRGYSLAVEAVDGNGRASERVTVIAPTAPCAPPAEQAPQPPPEPAQEPAASSAPQPPPDSPPPEPPAQVTEASTPAPAVSAVPAPPPGPPPPPSIWQTAGVFVWHEAAVDPEALGRELKDNGFGWVAVQLHDGLTVDPVQDDWVRRFREASGGLPVGGWGVLRTDPIAEAQLAQTLLARDGLDFYIADAEAEYKYSSDTGYSAVRYARSREFVDAFRAGLPDMPAAISSYCRADREDIDWQSWADGGFDFLPQAYVNDLGGYVTPAQCADGAAKWFPADAVHPTIGLYASHDDATPATYAELLQAAHTIGFSVYLADTQKDPQGWDVLGRAIGELGIARAGGVPPAPGEHSAATPPEQGDAG